MLWPTNKLSIFNYDMGMHHFQDFVIISNHHHHPFTFIQKLKQAVQRSLEVMNAPSALLSFRATNSAAYELFPGWGNLY